MSRLTAIAGVKELRGGFPETTDEMAQRQRRCGRGKKAITSKQPEIVGAIERIVDPSTLGTPWLLLGARQQIIVQALPHGGIPSFPHAFGGNPATRLSGR
jgi:hypothetical protein